MRTCIMHGRVLRKKIEGAKARCQQLGEGYIRLTSCFTFGVRSHVGISLSTCLSQVIHVLWEHVFQKHVNL